MSDLTLSLARFAAKLRVGDANRIWLGPLRSLHGSEKHTEAEWYAIIDELSTKTAKR